MDAAALFVGRRQEMAAMRAALDAARGGRGQLILLSGEPGIGKTRIAMELADQTGIPTVWGRSHEEAGAPPYFLWAQVVRTLVQSLDAEMLRHDLGPGAADIAEIVPDIRDRLPGLDPPAPARDPAEARFRLFDSLSRFLIAVSRRKPLSIVLDDLHWADVPSLRFLEFLLPETADSNLLLIGTYRVNELSRQHPLSDTLGSLGGASRTVRIHLAGLDAEEVRHFVALAAGAVPPAWLTRSIHAQTEGNPLFLREVVRFLRQQGHFDATAEGQTQPVIRIPEGVREVIGRRLNLLSAPCNAVLALAAVVGREFGIDVLVRAARDRPEDEVAQAIDEALDARILEETASDRYQFTHALIRMTLYDELRSARRRQLHRAVGEAIEALNRRDPEPVLADLARHFCAAGGTDAGRAIGYAIRAGDRADAVLAFEDAIGFFQTALDLIEQTDDPDPRQHAALLLSLGETQRKANDFATAKRTMLAAADMARRFGLHDLLADVAVCFEFAEWRHGYENASTASALLSEALSALPTKTAVRRIRVTSSLARARLYADAVDEAKALTADAVTMARALGDPASLASSLTLLTEFSWEPHETEGLLAATNEMVAAAKEVGDLEIMYHAVFHQWVLSLELGDIEQCRAAVTAGIAINERLRQPVYRLFDLNMRTTMALLRGDLAAAEALIVQAFRVRTLVRTQNSEPMSIQVFSLRREQGRLQELRPLVAAFAQTADAQAWRPGLALLHVEFGDLPAARAVFEAVAHVGLGKTTHHDGRWNINLVYLAEVCVALGDATRAKQLYDMALPWSGRSLLLGGGIGCVGAADRFLGMLAATMARWNDAERHFLAALAMNERIGALAPLAHTQHDFAAMLLERGALGDRERALALFGLAADRAAALGLVALARKIEATLAHTAHVSHPAPDDLTTRELEVLRLLAIGRGNADIALVLAISPNTVATHVKSIFAKTGCANRTEAATYAIRHGLQVTG